MFHTRITRASIDAHASLHASIRPRASRLSARLRRVSRGAGGAHRPSSLLAARPRPRETRARETRPRRDRDAFDRPRVGERERTRDATATRDAIARRRPSRAETKRNDDMSAKSGGGKGKSGNRTTPYEYILNEKNFSIKTRKWNGSQRSYYVVPYGPYYIWGATARILLNLSRALSQ